MERRRIPHDIEIIVDRNICLRKNESSITDSVNLALDLSKGKVRVIGEKKERTYSTKLVCPKCGLAVNEFNPRDFSYNSAVGACKRCKGLGKILEIVPDKFIVNPELSIAEGAIATMTSTKKHITYSPIGLNNLNKVAQEHGFDIYTPFNKLTKEQQEVILYGTGSKEYHFEWSWETTTGKWSGKGEWTARWRGLIPSTMQAYYRVTAESRKKFLESLMEKTICPDCKGLRLKPESLAVLFKGKNIAELNQMEIERCLEFFNNVQLTREEEKIAKPLLKEIKNRPS